MTTNICSQIPLIFTSKRLKFEKVNKDHKFHLSKILSNEKVQEAYNTGDKESFTNIESQFSIIEAQWQKYGYGLYILFNNETFDFIGFAGYHTVTIDKEGNVDCFNNNKSNDLELYIILMPQYWRQGYGFEAVSKLCEIAFKHSSFTSIIAYIEPKNYASIALIEKFNCKKEKKVIYNNKPHILYRIYKS
ncbi:GNAT family N-acetyltransferase [Candidatus Babela massiliensis]|nr:GNAT family N-acetyltransferase [Candidatus Babela massiliensis]